MTTAWNRVLNALNHNREPDPHDIQAVKGRCDQLYGQHPEDRAALKAACFGLITSGQK